RGEQRPRGEVAPPLLAALEPPRGPDLERLREERERGEHAEERVGGAEAQRELHDEDAARQRDEGLRERALPRRRDEPASHGAPASRGHGGAGSPPRREAR